MEIRRSKIMNGKDSKNKKYKRRLKRQETKDEAKD